MNTKVKYQYTYLIYSYYLNNINFEEYINNLLNNNKYKLKIFEKEKDFEIYKYFNFNIKENYLNTFYINKNNININYLLKSKCLIFEYDDIKENLNIKKNNIIYYNISKIEIICFKTGICFLVLKTNIINDNLEFKDVLNFNYIIKDYHSDLSKLKTYENIVIKTADLNNNIEFKKYLEEIIKEKILNKEAFIYSYVCVNSENWNNEYNKLENDFLKYILLYPNNFDMSFEDENIINRLDIWKYAKIGFSNNSMNLLTNNLENFNFTRLPFDYENKYLYHLILILYKNEYIDNIEKNKIIINNLKDYEILLKELNNEIIVEDEIGKMINKKIYIALNLIDKKNKIKNKKENIIKINIIKKYRNFGKIIFFILFLLLVFNLFIIL